MSRRGHWLCAAAYDRMTAGLERELLGPLRAQLLAQVTGRVLDLGAGTGANLVHLTGADEVVAVEPDPAMRRRLAARSHAPGVPVEVSAAAGESLPFADGSFDWVVSTCVLCSVADPARTLAEVRRVLAPHGRLVVVEHVRGTGALAQWQDLVAPLWSRVAAGCRPNRDIERLIGEAGLHLTAPELVDPFPAVVPTRPMIAGVAVPSQSRQRADGTHR